MARERREEWTVCGRLVGTATGWDAGEVFGLCLYDFEPTEGCKLPAGTPWFNFESGKIEYFDDETGTPTQSFDLIEMIGHLPKK